MKVKYFDTVRKVVFRSTWKVKTNLNFSGTLTDVWCTPDVWYNDTWYSNVVFSVERKKVAIAA
jgi:hypothetical protein